MPKNFMLFGFTRKNVETLKYKISSYINAEPRIIAINNVGHFFLFNSYGDLAETSDMIAIKLGFLRSSMKEPISSQQLIKQGIVNPENIKHAKLSGNGLAFCLSKVEPAFIFYKTLMSVPQVYYSNSDDEFICSDNIRCLVDLSDKVTLNEDILPYHFLFRHAPGSMTYFSDINRLGPGYSMKWKDGNLNVTLLKDLRFKNHEAAKYPDSMNRNKLEKEFEEVIAAYLSEIDISNYGSGNLLSGGVDSSLLQVLVNKNMGNLPARSFSLTVREAPSFKFEMDYAKEASKLLKTEHTFVDITPENYAQKIIESTKILGQPLLHDIEPAKAALAEHLAIHIPGIHYFFVGQGADTLFGLEIARKIKLLNYVRIFPGAAMALKGIGNLISPYTKKGLTILKGADILSAPDNPDLFSAPLNSIAVYTDLELLRHSLGDPALHRALEFRRKLEAQYLDSDHYTEKVHALDLLVDSYEIQVQSSQLFQGYGKEQIYPYMDEDIVRASFSFSPEQRFIKGLRVKYLLKDILEKKKLSTITRKKKGASMFTKEVFLWMQSGPLYEMVQGIERPGFLSKAEFETVIAKPDYFTWSLLTFDIFKKIILNR